MRNILSCDLRGGRSRFIVTFVAPAEGRLLSRACRVRPHASEYRLLLLLLAESLSTAEVGSLGICGGARAPNVLHVV